MPSSAAGKPERIKCCQQMQFLRCLVVISTYRWILPHNYSLFLWWMSNLWVFSTYSLTNSGTSLILTFRLSQVNSSSGYPSQIVFNFQFFSFYPVPNECFFNYRLFQILLTLNFAASRCSFLPFIPFFSRRNLKCTLLRPFLFQE